jgi:anaerobic magnesium-protoporphyrin IX monomethyl ester cyclase
VRVTLCYPSLLPGHKPKYGLQPLGVLYIGALLRRHGIDVTVLDADVDGLTVDEMVARILDSRPDLIGFSLMTPQLMPALQTCAQLKAARPDLPIVLGGAHIDSTHEDVFSMADCFDFAIHGEGEYALLESIERLQQPGAASLAERLAGVGNVIYRSATGAVIRNPARPFLANLDELPSVDYDMVDARKYLIPTMAGSYVISMMLSRGCPFKCTFCDAPITMGKKLRFWSMERIIHDIRYYSEKYGCRNFVFKDSTFTANKKWADKFCDALIDAKLDIRWRCNTRVNLVPPPLLEKMKRAGCYVINFGVESGDPTILKTIEKETKIEDIYDAHRRCRTLGIRTYATFLVGSPGETERTVNATIRVATGIRPNLAMFFVATAYPGTPLYDQAVAQGLVEPRWWASQAWDPTKNSAFQARWGWTAKGGLIIPGFDSEYWQRKATRAFYLRPFFVWDTASFVLRNPYFLRHVLNLGKELVPLYKLSWPWKRQRATEADREMERAKVLARCPSAPNWDYTARSTVASAPVFATLHTKNTIADTTTAIASGTSGLATAAPSAAVSRSTVSQGY